MVIGLNHRTAPLAMRERFWISENRRSEVLRKLKNAEGVEEVLVLSTRCRIEFLVWASEPTLAGIARAAWKLGDYKAAREHFLRARDLDTLRFRADTKINEINRSVAASTRVALVDAEKILSDAAPDGIIGSDLIYEHVHMTPESNYLLARAIFAEIAPNLPQGTQASEPLSEADCDRLLALTGYDRWRLANEMFCRLQKALFTNQLNHSEQLFHFAWGAERPNENPNDTVAQYQWAIARRPDDAMLHLRFGGFLFPYNRNAAAEQIGMAQPWDGYPMFLPDGTQVR